MYLNKKMLRDMWKYKMQFAAILLTAFLSVFIYSGIMGLYDTMKNSADQWLVDSNTANIWINGTAITDDDLASVKKLDCVKDTQAETVLSASLKNSDKDGQVTLVVNDKINLSQPKIISGDKYDSNKDGIWLYEYFAEEHNIKVGDTITLTCLGKEIKLKVNGLILSPMYLHYTGSSTSLLPDRMRYGYGIVSEKCLEKHLPVSSIRNQIEIKLDNENMSQEDISKLREDTEDILGSRFSGFRDRSDFVGISVYYEMTNSIKSMAIMFSALFMLLSLLTINSTMQRMIETQRTQIGILKAMGCSDRLIRVHYSLYGLVISLIGAVIGLVAAPFTLMKMLIDVEKSYYSLYEWPIEICTSAIIIAIAIVLCCTLTSALSTSSGIRYMPAETMREKAPKPNRKPIVKRIPFLWKILSYDWQWAFRENAKNRKRTIIGIISVAGSMMLLMAGFGMSDSLSHANVEVYGSQYTYGSKIVFSQSLDDKQKSEVLSYADGGHQWMWESSVEIRVKSSDATKNTTMEILSDGDYVRFLNENSEKISLPNSGAVVSKLFAKNNNINIGDTIQVRPYGSKDYVKLEIKEITSNYTPQGIFISQESWESLDKDFEPNTLLTKSEKAAKDTEDLEYVSESVTLKQQLSNADEVVSSMMSNVMALLMGAIALCVIMIYNLGMLNLTENSREFATQKVLGYHNKEIRKMLLRENIIQILVGMIIGIPIGYWFANLYVSSVSTSSFEYVVYLSPVSFILSIVLVLICAYITICVVSRKVNKIDMVEALKSVN